MQTVKLTALSHGAGCACKLSPAELHPLLAELPRPDDPNVLVGADTADDAAAYRVSDDLAILTTVDFFTPIVDDPYDFGRIAATNALSDIYAMGGEPLTALNLVAYSLEELGRDVLREILRGGHDAAAAAGGGVGGGVISTAAKRGLAPDELVAEAIAVMTTLNRDAAAQALDSELSAMTDVTGFGLLGHLHELAKASGVAAEIEAGAVPAIDGVLELLISDEPPIAGGTRRNREWVEPTVTWADDVPEELRWLVTDAMTSGGLLIAAAAGSGAPGTRIGRLTQ